MNQLIDLYTDGACLGNGTLSARGGWAAVLDNGEKQLRLSGYGGQTTNQRMELQAAIGGLQAIKKTDKSVHLHTDSNYLKKGCSEWMKRWKANGWRTADGKPVKNVDLWELLDKQLQRLSVTFHWIRGHNGHPMNELADKLAGLAARSGGAHAETRPAGDMSL